MQIWPSRACAVIDASDPALSPQALLDRLWVEVASWTTIAGLWMHTRAGHLWPSGIAAVGALPADVARLAAAATPTVSCIERGRPCLGKLVKDGPVAVATTLVAHGSSAGADEAAFLVDVLARYCLDRLRMHQDHALRAPGGRANELPPLSMPGPIDLRLPDHAQPAGVPPVSRP